MNTGSDAHAAIQPFVCGVRGDARAMKFSLTLTFQIYYHKRYRVYGAAVGFISKLHRAFSPTMASGGTRWLMLLVAAQDGKCHEQLKLSVSRLCNAIKMNLPIFRKHIGHIWSLFSNKVHILFY